MKTTVASSNEDFISLSKECHVTFEVAVGVRFYG